MPLTRTITELTACGFAVALSPLDIALVLLLLLGSTPLLKSSLFSGAWFVTNSVAIALLVTVGKGLTLSMEKGGIHQVGIDLFAAGALLALGIRELDPKPKDFKDLQGSWITKLEKVGQ
ncbi:MAG: GAP family protein, partial [Cyanobacteriota bacterium]|nr:GAP family protein [Cyanobacteriota bacterium]